MNPDPSPQYENDRLAALRRYEILDTPPEAEFDDFTRLAAHVCATPVAVLCLVNGDRLWFKSELGLGRREIPLKDFAAGQAMLQSGVCIVPDTALDERFAHHPLLAGDPPLRFYAGALLASGDGQPLGALCVLDHQPRQLTPAQGEALAMLARQVMTALELRMAHRRLHMTIESISDAFLTLDHNFRFTYLNSHSELLLGHSRDEYLGRLVWDVCQDGHDGEFATRLRSAVERQQPEMFELYYQATQRWLDVRVCPAPDGLTVYFQDITPRRQAEHRLARLNRLYAVSSSVNEAILRVHDTLPLYQQACQIAVEKGGLLMAWVGVVEPGGHRLKAVASHGRDEGYLDGLQVSVRPERLGLGPAGRAYREDRVVFSNDIAYDPSMEPWREAALRRGFRSIAAFPLRVAGRPIAVYTVYGDIPDYFNAEEFQLLNALADNLSFAVESHEREASRRQAEAALRSSEANMAAAQRIAHFGSWELDLSHPGNVDSNPLRWSDEMYRIAGFEPGSVDVTNDLFFNLVPAADHEQIRQEMASAIRERRQYAIVHRLIRPDGTERIVHERAQMVFDEASGELTRMIGTAHDITDRRQAEEALRESEERFRSFMAHSPAAGWITDANGRLRYVSPEFYSMFGINEADVTGRTLREVFDPALAELYMENNLTVLRQQSVMETMEPGRRWDGTPGEFLVVKFPITLPGRELMLGAIALDTTERKKAEQTLRESEARFRSYFEMRLHGIAITSPEKGWIEVNDYICDILGYTREELVQMTWSEMTHPDDLEPDVVQFNRLLAGEIDSYDMEKRFIRKDGRVIWTSLGAGGVRNPDGSVAYFVGVLSDITARKQAEEALRQSELRFRQIAENINEVFWITDPAMAESLYISPAYERVWGRSCESLYLYPNSWLAAIHPEDRARVVKAVHEKPPAGEYDETFRIVRPDGTIRWVHDRGYPVQNERGETYRMVGTAEDITERRLAEEKLREQATLLDKAQDAIVVRGLDHRIHYWNSSAERLYGWTAAEAMGGSIKEMLYRDPTAFLLATEATLTRGEWLGEIQQWDREGRALVVEARWTLVRDSQGNPTSILAINTDATERKNLQQQLLRAQRMESIGTLAGGIAHDLNNVLAPIMMSIELLRLGENSPQRLAILTAIEGSAKRGADMVKQVLSFARGVKGQQIEVRVGLLVTEIEKIVNETFLKNIEVLCNVPEDVWTVQGDPTQLHQVLLNLCVNARDAMPEGGTLRLVASNLHLDEIYAGMNIEATPGPHVLIQVEDTGTGIPPEVIDRMFEPFFTTKDLGKGTGLGLSSTLAIVKSHGGFLRVQSEVGRGTQFHVYLPAHTAPITGGEAPIEIELPRGNDELVLVVDDEPAVREITQQTLEAFGYRVLTACDGVEATALYAVRMADISVVLTDMMMPVMDGPTTIKALMDMNPQVRIIAASGINASTMVAKAVNAGVRHFLPKPYTAEDLLQALHAVLLA